MISPRKNYTPILVEGMKTGFPNWKLNWVLEYCWDAEYKVSVCGIIARLVKDLTKRE